MLAALCHQQRVVGDALADDIPGITAAAALAADADAAALAQGVERQADLSAELRPLDIEDRARRMRQELPEEFTERTLTDEADAGAVALGRDRQPRLVRQFTHLLLVQVPQRQQRMREGTAF